MAKQYVLILDSTYLSTILTALKYAQSGDSQYLRKEADQTTEYILSEVELLSKK